MLYVFHENNEYYSEVFLDECLYKLQVLEYDRIDMSKGTDANKTKDSQRCIICNYSSKFYDLMQRAVSFNNVTIIFVKRNDCRIHFWCMSKDEAINIMRSFDLNEKKVEHYKIIKMFKYI